MEMAAQRLLFAQVRTNETNNHTSSLGALTDQRERQLVDISSIIHKLLNCQVRCEVVAEEAEEQEDDVYRGLIE